ncbi:peptidoglycan-binding protein [Amycolatopsis jiangsuensis]|uniref:Peptidoglycan hydrolase-like protein with peptidoglycan-binding domain n=1 Tax=Amycolatopsis jiangsuensis TaxID=1181879 RepID=A0A840IZB6_9PSEU|nr:peptidoglycan-binding protein [Amycolatopsis jiangsuensis]MBB4688026.1 peptidoglycan hydrolase-like protein with peptidoglycan-binding domain [Amycolatopsis jiangsuensis]
MTGKSRRARWLVAVAAAVVVLGTTTVVVLTRVAEGASAPAAGPKPVETTEVVKADLSDEEEAEGTLGYGSETAVNGRKSGTLTWLPAPGSKLSRGDTVYGVDAKPVPLFYGSLPFYRDLSVGVDKGEDVKELEENLRALGFGGFGTPDTSFTSATAAAVKRWQKSLGAERTGTFGQGDVVLAAGELRVSEASGQLGGPAQGSVLKTTGTARSVEVKIDAEKQQLAQVDAKVAVTVNGTGTTGTVTDVGHVAEPGKDAAGQPNGKLTITVTVRLDDPKAAGSLDSAPVTVRFTKDVHKGVLAVPVGALLALAEGGYAVQVEQNGQQRLIGVETGLFSGGKVEVSGTGLAEGMRVVTTS